MASVIKLINDLIGKEDVAWGDSSSTFDRETYVGGTTAVTYIDAECIPATTLGGYIGDYLHTQHTDTGTTSATFDINSSDKKVVLSSSGLTANRTFTFPNTSNQELVGATDLASVSTGLGASTVGVEDAGGYYGSTDVEAALQEVGADITTLESTAHYSGMKYGFKLGYSSTDAISINGGMWAHNGTTNQHLYTDELVTFTLGPAGSNSTSSNMGASEVHYIYIHDTAVVALGDRELTAAEFKNSTTAPSWSHSKLGWYNSNDRAIGAIITTDASEVKAFRIASKHYYRYGTPITVFSTAAAGTTWAELDLSGYVPIFCEMVRLGLTSQTAGTTYYFNIQSNTTQTPEIHVPRNQMTIDIPVSAAQLMYWYASAAANTAITLNGYYIDGL